MKIGVYNSLGQLIGRDVELSDDIFSIVPNDNSIYLDIKSILANKRQGSSKTKDRGEVSGSTRKLKKQKGTGTARAGSIKSPIFRGGGRIFGPIPREYDLKVNKKVKKLAKRSALSYKIQDNGIFILDKMSDLAPKTKNYIAFLDKFGVSSKKVILILSEKKKNLFLASRNLKNTVVSTFEYLNTYSILDAQIIIIEESALSDIERNLF